jgi:insertion element IS1 protein InsB
MLLVPRKDGLRHSLAATGAAAIVAATVAHAAPAEGLRGRAHVLDGDTIAATLERLLGRVKRWNPRLYCTDDWAAYAELIPQGRLFVGKEETHGIERDHARQRHWLARFRRRSIVVSKTKRMVDASIALFGGNDRIGELAAMLT